MENDIRWQQRFEQCKKAFSLLISACEEKNLSLLEKEGIVQRFEYTFELAWKTMKDYLNYKGIDVSLPRDVIKQAFAHSIITNGELWIRMLESRNVMSHAYDERAFERTFEKIQHEYSGALQELITFFDAHCGE